MSSNPSKRGAGVVGVKCVERGAGVVGVIVMGGKAGGPLVAGMTDDQGLQRQQHERDKGYAALYDYDFALLTALCIRQREREREGRKRERKRERERDGEREREREREGMDCIRKAKVIPIWRSNSDVDQHTRHDVCSSAACIPHSHARVLPMLNFLRDTGSIY